MKNREGTTRQFYIMNCRTIAKNASSYSVGLYNILNDESKQEEESLFNTVIEKKYDNPDLDELKEVSAFLDMINSRKYTIPCSGLFARFIQFFCYVS